MAAAIELNDVCVARNGVSILEHITCTIESGLVTAIIGPNGAGKTTLLSSILGLTPYSGGIRLLKANGSPNPRVGYVPQRLDFDRNAPVTVLDFLASSGQRLPLWFGATSKTRNLALDCLRRVQGERLIDKPLGRLSGGEFQRVQLALALQIDPEILLLDEPVAGVDIEGERMFCDVLEDVHRKSGLTMVMVSHDLSVVSRHAQRVLCLNRRLQCEGPTPAMLTQANLAAIYGPHAGIYDHHAQQSPEHIHDHAHCGHHHHH